MNKFKVGDEVVVIRTSFDNDEELGWTGTVYSTEKSGIIDLVVEVKSEDLISKHYGYKLDDIELISVFNSPLYNALK